MQHRPESGRNRNTRLSPNRRPDPRRNGRRPTRRSTGMRSEKRGRPVKRRFDLRSMGFVPIIIGVAVLAFLIYIGNAWFTVTANSGTYCKNITINGVDMDKLSRQDGIDLVQGNIDTLLNSSYTLTYGDQSWSFTPKDFKASMDATELLDRAWNIGHYGGMLDRASDIRAMNNAEFDWSSDMTYDDTLVGKYVDSIYDAVYVEPVNAEVTITEDQPVLTGESKTGLQLDWDATHDQIVTLLTTGEGSTALKVDVVEPAISSDAASNGLELIVDFSTDITFRGWHSRFNVRKALDSFNGLCVSPGDTISFNDIVGMRNEENGWQKATEYAGGRTTEGYGGGVCQAASTLYNAIMRAGMTVITRYPHSMTVTYLDPSLDAAVTNTNKNLVFRNDTDSPIYIYTKTDKTVAEVMIYGKRPKYRYELESVIIAQAAECTKKDYIYDTEGKYVYYTTDAPVLYSAGHPALTSESYLLSYDWDTGELMDRVQLTHDQYSSGTDIYWKGVHNPDGTVIDTGD